jgi:nitrogen fixation-related uncharacterized protein
MMDFEILGPYVVALLMSIGAVCVFVWGVLSGAFTDAEEEVAVRFYRVEMENDRKRASGDQPEE